MAALAPKDDCRALLASHVPVLDGLRGLAILLVLLVHTCHCYSARGLFDLWIQAVESVGWCGVDLFFVLSGFLITGILYDSKGGPRYFRNFYARRLLRIFPLYYGFLLLYCVIAPRVGLVHHVVTDYVHRPLAFWCYFSNLAIAFGGDDHSSELVIFWSLAIEEQFYLCWPLMVNRFSRERLLSLCPAVMLGSLLLRCSLLVLLHDAGRIPIHFLTPCRLDGLAAGAFVALCLRGRTDWEALGRRALKVILGSGLLLMGIFARGQSAMGAVVETIGFSALAVFFAASLVLFLVLQSRDHASWAVQTCANPILRLFGRYSYAMYVFHMAVIVYFTEHLQIAQRLPTLAGSAMLAQMSFQLVIIALVLALSVASWHLYEKHFLRMKSFFPVARIGP